jgi:hypothetical protein
MTNPHALALAGQPFEMSELQAQSDDSITIDMLRQQVMQMAKDGEPYEEINKVSEKYIKARQAYSSKYGVAWSENHHKAITQLYTDKLMGGTPSALPDGTPIPNASAGVVVGAQVKLTNGKMGVVVGPGTTAVGTPGVVVQYSDGTQVTHHAASAKKLSPAEEATLATIKPPGETMYYPGLGAVTVTAAPVNNSIGAMVVSVTKSDGSTTTVAAELLSPDPPASTPAPADTGVGGFAVGFTVNTPAGPGTISDISPSGKKYEVTHPDGTKTFVDAADVSEIPPSMLPSAPVSTSSGFLPTGTTVSTPGGNGIVVGSLTTASGLEIYKVKLSSGVQISVIASDVAEITPTAPPTVAPTPTPNPGVTYDADGVPILTGGQETAILAQFQDKGVNWYNPSEKLFDAAYAASQSTGLSIADVLKYADANFHNSAKDGGKPIQTKIVKWAKSSKGKAHIQATLGLPTAAPVSTAPTPPSPPSPTLTTPPTPSAATPAAPLPGTSVDISGIPNTKQTQALSQFTAGYVTINDSPGSLAQKAADVAKNTGLTPEQVLAIVDAKKAAAAGVPDGKLFSNKVLGHLNGQPFPTPTPPGAATSGSVYVPGGTPPFDVTPGFDSVTPAEATQLQAQMVGATAPLTAGQTASLRYYTSNNYGKINGCLRFNTGCTPAVKKHIAQGTAGMRPTTQNITTFRGTGFAAFGVSNVAELEAMVGQTVQEPGFSSTSISPGSAFGGSVAMQIEIPAGTNGSYVGNISHYKSEKEFVLPPGTKFRIVEVKPGGAGGKKALVRVEVVPA